MFDVEFKVEKLLNNILVNNELKIYYEQTIKLYVLSKLNNLNLEKLSSIIVPESFVEDVLEFQEEKGILNPNVTNTKFARAYGKMIFVPKEDKYYVFVDADKAVFIVDDKVFESFFGSLDAENYELCIVERKRALNLLAHELSHVELESNVQLQFCVETLRDEVISMWKQIFEEYYACRRASKVYGDYSVIEHNENYLNSIENEIMIQRKRYNYRKISLDDFCQIFHKYARMSLIHVVSELGSVKELNGNVTYEKLKIAKYIVDLDNEFDKMYEMFFSEGTIIVSGQLINMAFDYFAEFRIFITETKTGTRYDIPI